MADSGQDQSSKVPNDPFNFTDVHEKIKSLDYYKASIETHESTINALKGLLKIRDERITTLNQAIRDSKKTLQRLLIVIVLLMFIAGIAWAWIIGGWVV